MRRTVVFSMPPTISPNSATVELQALVTTLKTAADTASVSQAHLATYLSLSPPGVPAAQAQLAALVACIEKSSILAAEAQAYLAGILLRTESMGPAGSMRDLLVPLEWVRVPPPSPAEVAASLPADRDPESYWVVLRGREPGLYPNSLESGHQTNGVPHQYQKRVKGRADALSFYAANYPDNIWKWVPFDAEELQMSEDLEGFTLAGGNE